MIGQYADRAGIELRYTPLEILTPKSWECKVDQKRHGYDVSAMPEEAAAFKTHTVFSEHE